MPHAAAIVAGAVIVGGAAWALNEFVIQPEVRRRRQLREDELEAEQYERAIALSIQEYEAAELERRSRTPDYRATASSASARYDEPSNRESGLVRRRQHADPFEDELEMQQLAGPVSVLFDAGPSSRLHDSRTAFSSGKEHSDEDAELAETARSLSIESHSPRDSPFDDASPELSRSGSPEHREHALEAYTVIEPTPSRPVSALSSRSHGSLVFLDAHSASKPASALGSPQARAASPTPTIRSLSDAETGVHLSRVTSPFSDFSQVSDSAARMDEAFASPPQRATSDIDSQWSDLGDSSSDEDTSYDEARLNDAQQQDLRDRRQAYFGARMATANGA